MSSVSFGRRADRAGVFLSLAGVTGSAWVLTVHFAANMSMAAGSMHMASATPGPGNQFVLVSAMWGAMMVGMMVPSATPMVVAYSDWIRRGPASGSRLSAVSSFVSGYVLVWLGFSVLAALLQVTFTRLGLLTEMGATSGPALGGAVLVLAGLFQVTPWKESCLRRCRTPIGFLIAEWREGAGGALIMGIRHGAYCLGCCWLLMAVLFVVEPVWLRETVGASQAAVAAHVAVGLGAALIGLVLMDRWLPRHRADGLLAFSCVATFVIYPLWLLVPGLVVKFALVIPRDLVMVPLWPILRSRALAASPGKAGTTSALGSLTGLIPLTTAFGWMAARTSLTWAMLVVTLGAIVLLMAAVRVATRPGPG